MKVPVINNFYQRRGGEGAVLVEERELDQPNPEVCSESFSNKARPRWRGILCVIGVLTLLALAVYTPTTTSAGDAVILYQYSRNLAATGVISYIPGGPRAEGATDFLWMLYIALGMKMHLAPEVTTAIANVAAIWGLGLVLLRIAGEKRRPASVLFVIGVLALFPQIQAALKGFSVLPFGFAISLTLMFALEGKDAGVALSSLLLCLIRPDGVVFAIPALAVQLVSSKKLLRSLGIYSSLYVVPGLIYFLWRWHYFGQLFPLPFLVKSNEPRVLGIFIPASARSLLPYMIFSAVIVAMVLGKRLLEWRAAWLVLVLLVTPSIFYSNIRLEQNLDDRFFFFVPLGLGIIVAVYWKDRWSFSRPVVAAVAIVMYLAFFSFYTARGFAGNIFGRSERLRIRSLASDVGDVPVRGTMLTSEADLLPYYSKWRAYDSWGLNTAEFARQVIQPEQVVSLHPDLIVLHGNSWNQNCTAIVRPPKLNRAWNNMVLNVQSGLAMTRDYESWRLPYGSSRKERWVVAAEHRKGDYECWYVSRTYAGRGEVEKIIERYGAVQLSGQE